VVKRALLVATALAACARLADDVLYKCEPNGSCFQPNHVCGADGYCHLPGGEGGGTAGGSALGGGAAAGGGAALGGGTATGGGGTGGGGTDGGCVPRACPGTVRSDCGKLDDGCGHVLDCGALSDGGERVCAPQSFCGAGADPNLCAAPLSCTGGWCWESPLPQGNTLRAVWATDSDRWAVGDLGTVLRGNGRYWKLAPSPTRSNLRAIAGRAPYDLWAAGDDGVILHFDGGSWAVARQQSGVSFRAIGQASSGEVFVGGTGGTVLELIDGGWKPIPAPLDTVNALWVFDAGLVYAGGLSAAGNSLAVRDFSWSVIPTAPQLNEATALLGLPGGTLIVGGDSCRLGHVDGTTYFPTSGGGGCDAGVFALAGTSMNDAVAFGPGFAAQLDGGSLYNGDAGTWRGAAASDAGYLLAAGDFGLLGYAQGGGITFESSGTFADVTSVFIVDAGVIAGSENGVVLARRISNLAGSWPAFPGQLGVDRVTAVWGTSLDDVWGVTDTGVVGHTLGNMTFSVTATVNPGGLFAITHHLTETQFGGFDAGVFRIPDGTSLMNILPEQLPNNVQSRRSTIRGLFSNGSRLFGVTDDGQLIASDDGHNWTFDLPIASALRAVHGTSGFVITVGPDGGAWTGPDNMNITLSPTGTHANLNATCAAGPNFAWAAGDKGTLLQLDGGTWQGLTLPTQNDLLGIAFGVDAGLFVVGTHGTVLHQP
jgi:hypothetical protein